MKTVKEELACDPWIPPTYDWSDPVWVEGYRDGQAQTWTSAPDARMGLQYCMGWLTGRLHR